MKAATETTTTVNPTPTAPPAKPPEGTTSAAPKALTKEQIDAAVARIKPLIDHLRDLRAATGLDSEKLNLLEAAEVGMLALGEDPNAPRTQKAFA